LARSHHIDAPIEQRLADIAREAKPRGGVFRVGNRQIDVVMLDEAAQAFLDEIPPRTANDVADEQNGHAG